jgi:PAS domain S-box-containing protein
MNEQTQALILAQQSIDKAKSADEVFDILRLILGRLYPGSRCEIARANLPHLPAFVRAAYTSSEIAVSDDSTQIAAPLTWQENTHGIIFLNTGYPLSMRDVSLILAISQIAGSTLTYLSWSTDPQVLRQLVENANVGIDVADEEGKIIYANRRAAELYGYEAPSDLIGKPVLGLYYGNEESRISRDVVTAMDRPEGWIGEVLHMHRDGTPMPVQLAVFAIRDSKKKLNGFGAVIQNISEQRRLLYTLKQQTRRLRAAVDVARATISKLDMDSLLEHVTSLTQALFEFDIVSINLIENGELIVKAASTPQGLIDNNRMTIPLSESSVSGWVAIHAEPYLVNDTSQEPRYFVGDERMRMLAILVVPMRLGDQVIGTMAVQSRTKNVFQQEDVDTFQGIADQLAVAVDNARLFHAERRQIQQLEALNKISRMLVAAYNLDELWGEIQDQIAKIFDVSTFYVQLYDANTNMLRFVWLSESGKVLEPEPPYPLSGMSGLVIRTGAPVSVNDLHQPQEQQWLMEQNIVPLYIPGTTVGPVTRSWLGVPMRARDGAIIGLISVQSHKPRAFDARTRDLLTTVATQVSLALENAELISQLNSANEQLLIRAGRMESLAQIGTILSSSLERQYILDMATKYVVELLDVDHCGIVLINDDNPTMGVITAEYPATGQIGLSIELTANPVFEAHTSNDVAVFYDVPNDPRFAGSQPILGAMGIKSMMIIRLVVKGKLVGSLGLDMVNQHRHFTPEDVETCRTLANQIGLAIENAELYERALEANELKSQFLATMSHELRTPLNAIIGYSEMLLAGIYGTLTDKQRDRLQRVFSNAQSLLDLINDVLDLAKIESGRMNLMIESLDVLPIINSAVSNITPQAEKKKLRVVTELANKLPPVKADSVRLRQIILNLLSNAVKFTHEGSVRIAANLLDISIVPPRIELPEGEYISIIVEDTGIGIAPENFNLIFDAFRQVDGAFTRQYEGTGLGLSITRQLLEMQGGRIWLDSQLGAGSRFTIVIPVTHQLEIDAT